MLIYGTEGVEESHDLSKAYQDWKAYCEFVDKVKPYISLNYPKYGKEQSKVRDMIYESSKLFPNSFLIKISDYLDNYNLNNSKKAKTDYLLDINLPGITKKNAPIIVDLYIESRK